MLQQYMVNIGHWATSERLENVRAGLYADDDDLSRSSHSSHDSGLGGVEGWGAAQSVDGWEAASPVDDMGQPVEDV